MGELRWLKQIPIVSLLVVVAIAAVPYLILRDHGSSDVRFEQARTEARTYLVRNPNLEVDPLGVLMLDPVWLEEMRAASESSQGATSIQLPVRMLARSQANLDELIEDAYQIRLKSDPSWRLGVLDTRTPTENYALHVFAEDDIAGIVLAIAVLLLVGSALERTWGSLIFAGFVAVAIPVAAQGYRIFDASSGVPWSGAAGLSGALLGAYFIRGLGGHFIVPGWILLPAWLGVESFVVRGFWIDDLTGAPWATLFAAVGFGALVSGGLRLMNIETRVDAVTSKRGRGGPNPIVARTARLRSDGDPYQAFDLIQTAWREDPKNTEIAEAFFSVAVEVGQPEAAAEAIVPILRFALRRGDVERALEYWFPLAKSRCEVQLEATASVRLGEALLDAGHVEEALFSLRGALATGVSPAHATRIVNIARDLDEDLAREAATIALEDPSLDPVTRAELEPIVNLASEGPQSAERESLAADTGAQTASSEPQSPLDRRVMAEHQAVETTAFPIDSDLALDSPPARSRAAIEDQLAAQALDQGALSAESLTAETAAGMREDDRASDSGDVLSHWNERGPLDGDGITDISEDLGPDLSDEDLLDADALEAHANGFDLEPHRVDLFDSSEDETDGDRTPMIDATDELTSPLVASGDTARDDRSPSEVATEILDSPAVLGQVALKRSAPLVEAPSKVSQSDAGASSTSPMRTLKALASIPTDWSGDWIEFDIEGRGKSKIPIMRIEGIALGAVAGLGPKPVLVVDLVLNWSGPVAEPLKVFRLRSDRFDPMLLEPGAVNPLAALKAWIERLQAQANATCLPSRGFLKGKFDRFESLRAYEREVLIAVRDEES
jgi:hypothetical protein